MIYFLFQFSPGDTYGGMGDLVAISNTVTELLQYTEGEIWSVNTNTLNHAFVCNYRGSNTYEYAWYVPGTWDKFIVSEVN